MRFFAKIQPFKSSVHHRYIQPELLRAEAGTDILGDADDRSGKTAADLAGFCQRFAVGQADDRAGKEGVPRSFVLLRMTVRSLMAQEK